MIGSWEFLSWLSDEQIKTLRETLREDQKDQFDALRAVLLQETTSHVLNVDGVVIKKWSIITDSSEWFLTIEDKEVPAKNIWYCWDNISIYSIDWRFLLAHVTRQWSIEHVFDSSVIDVAKPRYAFGEKDLKVTYADESIKNFGLCWWKHWKDWFLVSKQ